MGLGQGNAEDPGSPPGGGRGWVVKGAAQAGEEQAADPLLFVSRLCYAELGRRAWWPHVDQI